MPFKKIIAKWFTVIAAGIYSYHSALKSWKKQYFFLEIRKFRSVNNQIGSLPYSEINDVYTL
jgi:hypothetical protein